MDNQNKDDPMDLGCECGAVFSQSMFNAASSACPSCGALDEVLEELQRQEAVEAEEAERDRWDPNAGVDY